MLAYSSFVNITENINIAYAYCNYDNYLGAVTQLLQVFGFEMTEGELNDTIKNFTAGISVESAHPLVFAEEDPSNSSSNGTELTSEQERSREVNSQISSLVQKYNLTENVYRFQNFGRLLSRIGG